MKEIYLDNAATMPISKKALAEMFSSFQQDFANPSALHSKGYEVEKKITKSKEYFAKILGVSASEIFFTSGGTESNNMALLGIARANHRNGNHIIVSSIEHPSVLEAAHQLEKEGCEVTYLSVDSIGRIKVEDVLAKIKPETILISIMTVNNEVGVIQNIETIAQQVKSQNKDIVFHSDCVQAFGKIKMPDLKYIDSISLGAHKIGGPKGIGLFYLREGIKIKPLLFGGKHQSGLRPGTESYPAVRAFQVATEEAINCWQEHYDQANQIRHSFLQELDNRNVEFQLNGDVEFCSPFIINVSFPDIRAEVLLHSLEMEGIYVSTGSACQSKKNKASHVITAMNVPNKEGSIRLSLGYQNTEQEIVEAVQIMVEKVEQLCRFVRK